MWLPQRKLSELHESELVEWTFVPSKILDRAICEIVLSCRHSSFNSPPNTHDSSRQPRNSDWHERGDANARVSARLNERKITMRKFSERNSELCKTCSQFVRVRSARSCKPDSHSFRSDETLMKFLAALSLSL